MKTTSAPTLTIVAGPNGAGKSSISKFISPKDAFIFDPDREHARIRLQNPIWPEESVLYARDMYFGDQVDFVLMNKRSFTIETNLRDTELFNTVDRFKQAGYTTGIVFMMLANVGQSIERVNNRVREGGHFVDSRSIRQNYAQGFQNLLQYADRFDYIEILNAAGDPDQLRSIIRIHERQLVYQLENTPEWAATPSANLIQKFDRGLPKQSWELGHKLDWDTGPQRGHGPR